MLGNGYQMEIMTWYFKIFFQYKFNIFSIFIEDKSFSLVLQKVNVETMQNTPFRFLRFFNEGLWS